MSELHCKVRETINSIHKERKKIRFANIYDFDQLRIVLIMLNPILWEHYGKYEGWVSSLTNKFILSFFIFFQKPTNGLLDDCSSLDPIRTYLVDPEGGLSLG